MTLNPTENHSKERKRGLLVTVVAGFGAVALWVLIVLLIILIVNAAFHSSLFNTLRNTERLATFLANVLVAFYAFPAFRRTKDRGFLLIGFAALMFSYGALFSLLFGMGPPAGAMRPIGHSEAQWYYSTLYLADLTGFVSYACGVLVIARGSKVLHEAET